MKVRKLDEHFTDLQLFLYQLETARKLCAPVSSHHCFGDFWKGGAGGLFLIRVLFALGVTRRGMESSFLLTMLNPLEVEHLALCALAVLSCSLPSDSARVCISKLGYTL